MCCCIEYAKLGEDRLPMDSSKDFVHSLAVLHDLYDVILVELSGFLTRPLIAEELVALLVVKSRPGIVGSALCPAVHIHPCKKAPASKQ
jgi:hypothetical protein